MIKSEILKGKTEQERLKLQHELSEMSEEELANFRNSFDPDAMGFDGIEGSDDE